MPGWIGNKFVYLGKVDVRTWIRCLIMFDWRATDWRATKKFVLKNWPKRSAVETDWSLLYKGTRDWEKLWGTARDRERDSTRDWKRLSKKTGRSSHRRSDWYKSRWFDRNTIQGDIELSSYWFCFFEFRLSRKCRHAAVCHHRGY